jgi:hypothetical protein
LYALSDFCKTFDVNFEIHNSESFKNRTLDLQESIDNNKSIYHLQMSNSDNYKETQDV